LWQGLVHIVALAPAALLLLDAATGNLSANPIQEVTQRLGRAAFVLLVASLSCTPLVIVTGWRAISRWRRPLGVYAFLYALAHFVFFIGVDYGFNLRFILDDLGNKRYIVVGLSALLILLPLAVTSTKGWQARLGKRWQKLHRWVYLAGVLVAVHYAWALKSDIRLPLLGGAIVVAGLVIRTPPVRRWFVGRRTR
jgi:sulfoxide reductase heme-binding subunit YedZ